MSRSRRSVRGRIGEQARRVTIRPYRPADFEPVNHLWRRARVAAFPEFHARKAHPAEEDRRYFQTVILVKTRVFVAEVGGRTVAFMAVAGDFIDQLYVDHGMASEPRDSA